MQNICTFIYIKCGTSVQVTEAGRENSPSLPKRKVSYLLGSQQRCGGRFHTLQSKSAFHMQKTKQNSGFGVVFHLYSHTCGDGTEIFAAIGSMLFSFWGKS